MCYTFKMSDACAAYMGAMLDGEGHLQRFRGPTGRWAGMGIAVTNQNLEIISACFRIAGRGNITLNTRAGTRGTKKNVWVWYMSNKSDVRGLCQRIAPFSTKAQEYLQEIGDVL